jgi:hypothetical protein
MDLATGVKESEPCLLTNSDETVKTSFTRDGAGGTLP